MFPESELLPLSGLQHLAFCERQWALIHLEQFWAENRLTVEGRHLHERADLPAGKSRGDVRIVRGMPIQSLRLGLSGRADVVEFHRVSGAPSASVPHESEPHTPSIAAHGAMTGRGVSEGSAPHGQAPLSPLKATSCDLPEAIPLQRTAGLWRPFPIEYKRGKPKPGDCDRVQLCAQALCLEEMLGVAIPAGTLFYGRTRRREEIAFAHALRTETETLALRMHELFRAGVTPRVPYDRKRCDRCSLYPRCLPKTTGRSRSVDGYLAAALSTSEAEP